MNSSIINYGALAVGGTLAYAAYRSLSAENKTRVSKALSYGVTVTSIIHQTYATGGNLQSTFSLLPIGIILTAGIRRLSPLNQGRLTKVAVTVGTCGMLYFGYKDLQTSRALDDLHKKITKMIAILEHNRCLEFFSTKTISYPQSSIHCAATALKP